MSEMTGSVLTTWTIAYRNPRANRFTRVTNWTGTWSQAVGMAQLFAEANPDAQVFYVPSRESELNGLVPAEDIANILVDSGKRVRIVEKGEIPAEMIARIPVRKVARERWTDRKPIADAAPAAPATPEQPAMVAKGASKPVRSAGRLITFPAAGIVRGSRVWRNSETGVEIIRGTNYGLTNVYYVCVPTSDFTVREMVAYDETFAAARSEAIRFAIAMRKVIATAYDLATAEDEQHGVIFHDTSTGVRVTWDRKGAEGGLVYRVTYPSRLGTHYYASAPTEAGALDCAAAANRLCRTRLDDAREQANAENIDRWIVGGPNCSRDCDTTAGRGAPHIRTCPRGAYIAAGSRSQWNHATPFIEAAHAEAVEMNGVAKQREQVRGWMDSHDLLDVPGHQLAAATLAAMTTDHVDALRAN
jgi:hypothetical protein